MENVQETSNNGYEKPHAISNKSVNDYRVIKRNGKLVSFESNKIHIALSKAFLATEGGNAASSDRIHDIVTKLTINISKIFIDKFKREPSIHIEDIQDQVELALMQSGEHKVARSYVLYREERRKIREDKIQKLQEENKIRVKHIDGQLIPLSVEYIADIVYSACKDLKDVNPEKLIKDTIRNLFDGIGIDDIYKALILTSRVLIEVEPNYSLVTARLLLNSLKKEAYEFLDMEHESSDSSYPQYFKNYINKGIELNILDKRLKEYDLDILSKAINPSKDYNFSYLGLQTLYDRYFIHCDQIRYELPQAFFMRISMGLSMAEENKEEKVIEFYNLISSFDYMCSTPTLFNSGTLRPQLSSCFLTTIPDDLENIYGGIRDNALLSKFAGGIGNDWTPVRAMGAKIKGTNGNSLGVVPFMNVADATAIAVNQGGKRKGAVCAYLETWHLDIEDFIELRKNTGDDRRRTHDMNTANWIPDLFMKRVINKEKWTLFSPDETPDLHDLFGNEFDKKYVEYEDLASKGHIKNFKVIQALDLWRKMIGLLFETGHPWITFKDPCNIRSPQQHTGVVHSSNLCTEITLNTSQEEIAVCNLGSINLAQHVNEHGLDKEKLIRTINTAIRMLDNVIDINYYTVPQAKNSNMKHRPIGIGIMGFQDALYKIKINYSSDEAIEFADESMEFISYHAINASSDIAKIKGKYQSYEGSLWSKGILPIDSIKALKKYRTDEYLQQHEGYSSNLNLDWNALREKIKSHGVRNSNIMAIAPTATIANICGVTASIEASFQNLYVKSNMSGEFTIVNPYLVKALKELNLWDDVMVNDLKYYNGSVLNINRIPDKIKKIFHTAFEIDQLWLIKAASRRAKWIDQSQSLNLYQAQASGKEIDRLYKNAWLLGLKTTYYLRSTSASSTEKATINRSELNSVSINKQQCSINDEDCESCQ